MLSLQVASEGLVGEEGSHCRSSFRSLCEMAFDDSHDFMSAE